MKKYTIEEIKKWIGHYDPIFTTTKDILADLEAFDEATINVSIGYIPNTHVESENKFIDNEDSTPFCECGGENQGLMDEGSLY